MSYDVRRLQGPRMAGNALRVFAALVENPVSGLPLRRLMLQTTGLTRIRQVRADDPPAIGTPLPGLLEHACSDTPRPDGDGDGGGGDESGSVALEDRLPELEVRGFAPASSRDYTDAYRAGRTDPERVAERLIEAIRDTSARSQPLHILIAHDPEDLRAQARASAQRWQRGEPLGPLDGVPVVVKDEVDQKGYPTTAGTAVLGERAATADATAVARLRAAGALLFGKANMHEFGLGITGLNPHHGTARNPYDPARHTGGSSSGSAAAVAAGLCPLALGADGGGSIRIPAGLCGQLGLKPTFGRVSEHGAAEICWSVAHIGPIAATARDLALGYLVMAGPDPADPNTRLQPPVHLQDVAEGRIEGLRLGIYRPWFEDADPAVVTACRSLCERLEDAGARLVEIEIPEIGLVQPVQAATITAEMATAVMKIPAALRSRFGLDVRLLLALAEGLSANDYVHAQRLRHRVCRHFLEAFSAVDVIVTPSTASTAPPVPPDALTTGESNFDVIDRMMRFAPAANLTGHPAISIPAGYDEAGLPIGLQAIAPPWQEARLLRLAVAAEQLVERRRPAVHYRLLD